MWFAPTYPWSPSSDPSEEWGLMELGWDVRKLDKWAEAQRSKVLDRDLKKMGPRAAGADPL